MQTRDYFDDENIESFVPGTAGEYEDYGNRNDCSSFKDDDILGDNDPNGRPSNFDDLQVNDDIEKP